MTHFPVPGAVVPDPGLRDRVVVAGVGTTDFPADYRGTARGAGHGREKKARISFMAAAFDRAVQDSGFECQDIDGLVVCPGGSEEDLRRTAGELGISPRYAAHDVGIMAGVIPRAVAAIARGECRVIALVYAGTRRREGATFGGSASRTGPASYFNYHPWGWSSQAAHWALTFQRYMGVFGATEADLGAVAVTLRRNAMRNESAIMRAPLEIGDYLAARYVVRPLRLLDLCLVSDGGACLVLAHGELADRLVHPPVYVSGWGDAQVSESKFDYLVKQRLYPLFQESAEAAFSMANVSHSDIDLFEGYDSSSVQLINQLEGYGFATPGTALIRWADGDMELDGPLPVNTNGGMLSEAFMHGWTQVVELVRQLRHEAGSRQVPGARRGMSSLATTESAHPLILTRAS